MSENAKLPPSMQAAVEKAVAEASSSSEILVKPVPTDETREPKKVVEEKAPVDSEKGKAAIESLMKSLPPAEAAKLAEALKGPNPPNIFVENQNVFLGEAADKQIAIRKGGKEDKKGPTPIDLKRIRAFQERIHRWMNNHQEDLKKLKEANPNATDKQIEGAFQQRAMQALQQEDYDRLPPSEKIKRLEGMLAGSVKQIARDIMELRHNQDAIADAYEINYRALAQMFVKLGLPLEEQKKFMKQASDEIRAEHEAEIAKQEETRKKRMEANAAAAEKAKMESEAREVAKPSTETHGAELPMDATIFGG